MNNVYIYDGSFINLLNLLYYLFKNNIRPTNIKKKGYLGSLFDYLIELDLSKINKSDAFIKKLGKTVFHHIYYVYLSEEENKEIIIYYYLLNYFKYGPNLNKMRNLKCVSETLRISKKVGNEAHKMKGFIRFKELKNNILYANFAPDNNVLEIVSLHFKKRLANEYWLIKDEKRKIISIYDKKDFYILNEETFNISEYILSDNELKMATLWQTFYNTIGIKERKNPRCQMNFMPKKYWPYIIEMSGENEKSC